MEAILHQKYIAEALINKTEGAFGKKLGFLAKVFGCWHKELSRPFTNRNASYRACLKCGARKKFNPTTLKTSGTFFYPPAVSFVEK